MKYVTKVGVWLWGGLGNFVYLAGLVASFALPAWATRAAGAFSEAAPLSWVIAGTLGLVTSASILATYAWARSKLVRTRYDAKLLAQGGEIDPLAKTFERKRIFLNEFVLPSKPIIEHKTFIDCEIIGPATVIMNIGNNVADHRLPVCDAYVMSAIANPLTGYIFNNCVFRGCSFVRVSLMFSLAEYEQAKTVEWLNWISIRPDHLEHATVPALPAPTAAETQTDVKTRRWPWQK